MDQFLFGLQVQALIIPNFYIYDYTIMVVELN